MLYEIFKVATAIFLGSVVVLLLVQDQEKKDKQNTRNRAKRGEEVNMRRILVPASAAMVAQASDHASLVPSWLFGVEEKNHQRI